MSNDDDPLVRQVIRLLHRRRGWAWTCLASFIGTVLALLTGAWLFPYSWSATATALLVFMLGLLLLSVCALGVVIVDSFRIRHYAEHVRRNAQAGVGHYPIIAHGYRYPPRHRASWYFGWAVQLLFVWLAVFYLPRQIDAVAYLAGLDHQAPFYPSSHGQVCDKYHHCHTVTYGTIGAPDGPRAEWPTQVPLGNPVTVSAPVWAWGAGAQLIEDNFAAAETLFFGVIFADGMAAAAIILGHKTIRDALARRMHSRTPVPPAVPRGDPDHPSVSAQRHQDGPV